MEMEDRVMGGGGIEGGRGCSEEERLVWNKNSDE